MAVPTYVAAGAKAEGTGIVVPALPATIQVNDILLLFIETANEAIVINNQAGGTWAEVTNSPQGTGTAAAATATRLTVFWSRYNGTQTAPELSDSGDHVVAYIAAYRGVKTTGDPWNITSGNTDASDTSVSVNGATTTAAECLVVIVLALADDGVDISGAWTNASLTNITSRQNSPTAQGTDGRVLSATGEMATAGTYNASTNTINLAALKGSMTIALEPAATVTRPPRPTVVNFAVTRASRY